jgi:cellobiose-specific phosphotransferase system component IIA
MKKRFGMKLGESTRLLEAIQDQTDPQKGIDRIVKQLANPNITDAQKQSLELQKKQLEATKREKEVNKMLDGFDKMAQAALKDGATMDSILKEAKLTKEQATKNSADLTDKLSEKLKAAGKDFKSVVGMNEGELKKKMEQALKEGNVKEFNTLTNKLSEANKLADSAAKNNSNLQDKKETQEMKLNNRLLHALQPLADLLAASPLWLSNLVTIAGGIWAVYRLWSQGGAYAAIKGTFKTLKDTLGTKGSGWVHDPYVEKVNVGMAKNIALLAKNKAGWVGVKRRRDHTDIGGKVVPKAKVVGGGGGGLGGLLGGGMGGMGGLAGMGKTVAALAALGPIIMAIGVAIAFIMGMFSEEEMQEIFKPLIDVWTELKNVLKGELTSLLKDAVATITPIIKDMLPMFIDIIKTVFTVVKPVVEVLMQLVAIVMQVYSIFYQLIWAVLKPLWMIVGTLFKVFAKIIKAVLKPFIIIFRLFGKIIGKLVKIFGKLFEPLLEKFVKLIEYLISPLEMAADWLEKMLAPLDAMGDSFESLEKPLNEVWQVVKWLLAPFKVLWEGLKKVWKVIKVILSPLTAFWDILTKLWNIGKDITLPFQMFWDVLTKLWDVGKNLISPLTTIVDVLSQIMSFDFSGLASNFANAVGGIFSTAANKVGEMFGNIANGAKTLADTGRGIIQSGAESLGLGAEAKAVGDFFDSLNPFHTGGMVGGPPGMEIPLVAQAGEAILTPDQQMFVSESMSRLIDTIGSIQKQMDSLKQPSNIFEIGASLIDRIFPSATPSMNRGDFDSQIQAKVQSSQPSAASSAATTQLAEIAANTAATVDELQNAVDVLEDIRDKMNGGSGSSDTRSKTKPRGTPNFFNWAFGRFSDTSAKQRVNPGY